MISGAIARAALDFARSDALAPGDAVAPGVRLVRSIGRGAMGEVWLASHERLGIDVVVKTLARERLDDPGFVERFQGEARALARVKSANVVRAIDHGFTDEGVPFLIAERLEGEDLAQCLARGPLDADQVVALVRDAARGLAAAHREGIFHRDVKPSNVFLTREDDAIVAKIIDFGVAKTTITIEGAATEAGTVLGTPHYMSPEQIRSPGKVDHRADVWSLAVVAYECLTGHLPFEAETLGDLAVLQDRRAFPRPSAHDPALRRFDAWFTRAFDPAIDVRFADATELADTFARAAQRPRPRARWIFGSAAALGAVALVGLPGSGARTFALTLDRWPIPAHQPAAAIPAPAEAIPAPAAADDAKTASPSPRAPAAVVPKVAVEAPPPVEPREAEPQEAAPPPVTKPRKDRGF